VPNVRAHRVGVAAAALAVLASCSAGTARADQDAKQACHETALVFTSVDDQSAANLLRLAVSTATKAAQENPRYAALRDGVTGISNQLQSASGSATGAAKQAVVVEDFCNALGIEIAPPSTS
jgi:hypothetical protein